MNADRMNELRTDRILVEAERLGIEIEVEESRFSDEPDRLFVGRRCFALAEREDGEGLCFEIDCTQEDYNPADDAEMELLRHHEAQIARLAGALGLTIEEVC